SITLRGLVACHRPALTTAVDGAERKASAGQLRILAEAGVAGAAPDEWYGVTPPSSTAPLRDLTAAPVKVSPSRLEAFEECGLNWVVSSLGGDTVAPPSAGIGTIVHEAMEKVPDGDLEAMRAIVDEHWPELDFETEWIGRKERRRAELYVERLHSYIGASAFDGGRVVGAEAAFRFAVDLADGHVLPAPPEDAGPDAVATPRAVVGGVIDRAEVYPAGAGEHAAARGQKWGRMSDGGAGER